EPATTSGCAPSPTDSSPPHPQISAPIPHDTVPPTWPTHSPTTPAEHHPTSAARRIADRTGQHRSPAIRQATGNLRRRHRCNHDGRDQERHWTRAPIGTPPPGTVPHREYRSTTVGTRYSHRSIVRVPAFRPDTR